MNLKKLLADDERDDVECIGGVLSADEVAAVRGNSIRLAEPSSVPLSAQFCGLLAPGGAAIRPCETLHHSAPNTTELSRLGLHFVHRGSHTQTDPVLEANYTAAATATPPA